MDVMSIIYPVAAIGGLGAIFGAGLGFASQKFAVEVDETVEQVLEKLPGANCGGCGYAGCEAFAKAVVAGEAKANGCPVNSIYNSGEISDILGRTAEVLEKQRAVVACHGTNENAKEKYEYYGIKDCRDAALIPGGGSKACSYGCLGLASCVDVCVFGAMHMEDGVAVVNSDKCTACGACVRTCPRDIIRLIPEKSNYNVTCMSHDKGKDAKANCDVACIGCGICARNCPVDAITMEDKLARIDQSLCISCGICEKKCPTDAIWELKNLT